MAHSRRQPENRETDHSQWRSRRALGARTGLRGAGRARATARTPTGRWTCLIASTMCTPANGIPKHRSDPLDRRGGPHHEGPRDRRRIKRLAPENRREIRSMQQVAKLRFRIGQALAVRGAVRARPDAAAGGNDHDNSALRRGDAPQFFKQRVRPIGRFQGVSQQQPVDGAVRQRQHLRIHQRRGATPRFRPDRDPLFSGHQGQASASAVAESFEIRRAITHRSDREADGIVPTLADHAPDQPTSNSAEGRAVEALQAEDVERHRYRPDGGHDFERPLDLSQCADGPGPRGITRGRQGSAARL